MNFGLSESQIILRNNARKFFSAECPMSEVRRISEMDGAFDAGLYAKLAAQGFTGIIFPEQFGGLGLGMVEMAALLEEMGRALVPGPYFSSVLLAGTLIDAAGSQDQKSRYLTPIAEGEKRASLAMLEPSANWNPESVAMREQGGGELSGEKLFVTDAAVADTLVVVARREDELALYAVDAKSAGVRVRPTKALDLTRPLYEVQFDSAQGDLLASGAAAQQALEHALAIATVGAAAELVGGMQRSMEMTVEYAKTRKQFGKPIGSFQAVQHQCADMFLWTESSRSAVLYAAWALEHKAPEARSAVSIAKLYASDAARETGNRAIQVHGGMGFTWENDSHLYYRRAKALEVMLGDSHFHRDRLAELVIDGATAVSADATAFVTV